METRSVCPENRTGGKGMGGMAKPGEGVASQQARDLGIGWKLNPFIFADPGENAELMDVLGPGVIQHIWMTCTGVWRNQILRIYWDGEQEPAVECPVGDFFACGWGEFAPVNSLAVCVNPGSAFNCYWPMPFRKRCRITLENRNAERVAIYYQITYGLTQVPEDAGYFAAQFRRVNPLPYKSVYTILDGIHGKGRYVGTYLAWGINNNGWWGEGEIKFFLDGDKEFPTICGTGTEDYFCGSYNFENKAVRQYQEFCTPYSGLCQVIRPDGLYKSQMRFGMYRWHLTDPICFLKDIRVTIQALGWRSGGRYLPGQDDIASVAYWYQDKAEGCNPELPDRDAMEII
jgi:hypothetical protein